MKNLDQFLDEAQSAKCPKGYRFDTKLKSCVPKKRYPYYPYGGYGRNREEPKNGKGLYFMDTSSAAAECVTLQAAGGFNIHLFPTGQGNIIGNPIEPVVKLTANPLTAKLMSEHVDCDVSKILSREMNLDQAGDELIKATIKVANGRLTCAEALGHKEFVMTKLYRSA